MNEEKYVLAMLKRELVNLEGSDRVLMAAEVLRMIARIEADAVLGEETDEGHPFNEEVE